MSFLMSLFVFGGDFYSLLFFIKVSLLAFSFLWVRGTCPRYRYDKLMYLSWSSFLPVSLNYFLFFVGLSVII